ncbi:MAG: M81 family metallopeptidase, partial [Acidobacteria bacterium]|nr:M81 family metallopeptidase [Acidobacteriota bacterium]
MRFPLLVGVTVLMAAAETRRPVIAVGGISHESNSFNPAKTALADFGLRTLTVADLKEAASGHDILAGVVEGARQFGLDLYPAVSAGATPKGTVSAEAFEVLTGELVKKL